MGHYFKLGLCKILFYSGLFGQDLLYGEQVANRKKYFNFKTGVWASKIQTYM